MIKKVIKYLFKTDDYLRENAGLILDRIKSGEFDNERRNNRNEVSRVLSDDVNYLYIDVKLIYMDSSRFTTIPKDVESESAQYQEDHGFQSWRFLYMMFEDGTEFFDPAATPQAFEKFKEYMEQLQTGILMIPNILNWKISYYKDLKWK